MVTRIISKILKKIEWSLQRLWFFDLVKWKGYLYEGEMELSRISIWYRNGYIHRGIMVNCHAYKTNVQSFLVRKKYKDFNGKNIF